MRKAEEVMLEEVPAGRAGVGFRAQGAVRGQRWVLCACRGTRARWTSPEGQRGRVEEIFQTSLYDTDVRGLGGPAGVGPGVLLTHHFLGPHCTQQLIESL